MKKILLLAVTIFTICTATFAGCNEGKTNRANDTIPETQTIQNTQTADCNDGNCKQPELEEELPDEDRIPEVRHHNHIKRRRNSNRKPNSEHRPEPRQMPRILK